MNVAREIHRHSFIDGQCPKAMLDFHFKNAVNMNQRAL